MKYIVETDKVVRCLTCQFGYTNLTHYTYCNVDNHKFDCFSVVQEDGNWKSKNCPLVEVEEEYS